MPASEVVKACPLKPALVKPVPPCAISIVVALHIPVVIVPKVFKLLNEVKVVLVVAVILSAIVAVNALPLKESLVSKAESV